jgi:hypothetical protein
VGELSGWPGGEAAAGATSDESACDVPGIRITWPHSEHRPRLPCARSSTANGLPQLSHVKLISIPASLASTFDPRELGEPRALDRVQRRETLGLWSTLIDNTTALETRRLHQALPERLTWDMTHSKRITLP